MDENQIKAGQGATASTPDQETVSLFDQPYIDPLTEYLRRYEGDPTRKAQLKQVGLERERRCAAVARRYNTDEITEAGLALYRRGYNFSCPEDVAAYEARLNAMQAASAKPQDDQATVPLTKSSPLGDSNELPGLNDCYLLTRIRNFSEALEACRGPAEAGVAGAQASMAQIQSALGHYESAYRWAQQAGAESGQAAYLLGEMYAEGRGVPQDRKAANKWYRVAADLGHKGAQIVLDELAPATADANGR